jgi:hypothetical protein
VCVCRIRTTLQQIFQKNIYNSSSRATPSAFSILELITPNHDKGLRLPQLNQLQRAAMQGSFTGKESDAVGLQIFNTTFRCVDTWNGAEWISSCGIIPCAESNKLTAFGGAACTSC